MTDSHIVPYDSPARGRGMARALCGALVGRVQADPATCHDCIAVDEQEARSLAALTGEKDTCGWCGAVLDEAPDGTVRYCPPPATCGHAAEADR